MADPTQPITFVYADWVGMFPEFAAVSPAMGAVYFQIADAYFANSIFNPAFGCGDPLALERMTTLSYLVTAHIAWLLAPRDLNGNPSATGVPASPLVGRISSATEGSVSLGIELTGGGSPSEAFFTQTKYGFMFWQATAGFRTAQYLANPTYVAGTGFPIFPGYRGRRGGGLY